MHFFQDTKPRINGRENLQLQGKQWRDEKMEVETVSFPRKQSCCLIFLMLLWDKIEFQCGCRLANGPLSEQAAYWQRMEKGMGRRDPLLREAGEKPVTPLLLRLHFQRLAGFCCLVSSSGECGCVYTEQCGQEYVRFALPCSWTPVWPKKSLLSGHDLSCFGCFVVLFFFFSPGKAY